MRRSGASASSRAIADGALGHLQAGGPAAQLAAVAPPGQTHAVAPGPRLQVLEVEPEDVVPLDDVGIALEDQPRGLLEQCALVEAVTAHHVTEARRVGERDGDDAIGL